MMNRQINPYKSKYEVSFYAGSTLTLHSVHADTTVYRKSSNTQISGQMLATQKSNISETINPI